MAKGALKFNFPEPEPAKMSVSDLINQCNDAARKMSGRNDHKMLIITCAFALRQLVDRLAFHEDQQKLQ